MAACCAGAMFNAWAKSAASCLDGRSSARSSLRMVITEQPACCANSTWVKSNCRRCRRNQSAKALSVAAIRVLLLCVDVATGTSIAYVLPLYHFYGHLLYHLVTLHAVHTYA